MTNADVLVEDRLFATLDTRTRRWSPAKGVEVLVSDTVGFVKDLPHQLVASFKATLEEAVNADLLIHVVDVANPEVLKQIDSVKHVLAEIGCGEKPILTALNKVDVVRNIGDLDMVETLFPDAVSISAKTGFGLDKLANAVTTRYRGTELVVRVVSSQANGKVQSFLRAHGLILSEHYADNSIVIDARLGRSQLPDLQRLHPDAIDIVDA